MSEDRFDSAVRDCFPGQGGRAHVGKDLPETGTPVSSAPLRVMPQGRLCSVKTSLLSRRKVHCNSKLLALLTSKDCKTFTERITAATFCFSLLPAVPHE